MRSFAMTTFALALAFVPTVAFAQQQPPTQPPAQQPPAGAAQPAAPAPPKLTFKTPAGILFVQVKPGPVVGADGKPDPSGQTYQQVFEEMMNKLIAGLPNAADPDIKAEAGSWKYFKGMEPGQGGNVMYVVLIDPARAGAEYQFFEVIQKSLTDEQKRDPATAAMYQKYNAAIAGMQFMNLTPSGGK